jgi:hypothetical protein
MTPFFVITFSRSDAHLKYQKHIVGLTGEMGLAFIAVQSKINSLRANGLLNGRGRAVFSNPA